MDCLFIPAILHIYITERGIPAVVDEADVVLGANRLEEAAEGAVCILYMYNT